MVDKVSFDIDVDQIVTDAVVEEYWEQGYWVSAQLFDDEQVQRLREAHERFWHGDYDHNTPSQYGIVKVDLNSPKIRQQCNAFWMNDEIRAAVTSPILGAIGARFMKVDVVRLWADQAIYKPGIGVNGATGAGNIGWHQDYSYWESASTTNMCTAWVALQDTDLSNGGMRTIVGSHKWGLIQDTDTFFDSDLEGLANKYAAAGKGQWLDEPCIMKAGQVSFHHSLTFHGSGPNLTDVPRLSVVAHMMPGDTVYRAGQHPHPNVVFLGPNPKDGAAYDGNYWPVLWPAP